MKIFKKSKELGLFLSSLHEQGHSVGFVPTMGALHEGHLDLVTHSLKESNATVVSIFVNPTQFNEEEDLKKYPRDPGKDILRLSGLGDVIVFLPEVAEIYPPGEDLSVDLELGKLATVMEGKFRPGHFAGVAQVVKRLLDLVGPQALFMGQKDLQQLRVIKKLIQAFKLPVHLREIPTIREPNGLAMSSRNLRLSEAEREQASHLYRTLSQARDRYLEGENPSKLMEQGFKALEKKGFEVEYFEIVDAEDLQPLKNGQVQQPFAVCTAAVLNEVRLIDNVLGKP